MTLIANPPMIVAAARAAGIARHWCRLVGAKYLHHACIMDSPFFDFGSERKEMPPGSFRPSSRAKRPAVQSGYRSVALSGTTRMSQCLLRLAYIKYSLIQFGCVN